MQTFFGCKPARAWAAPLVAFAVALLAGDARAEEMCLYSPYPSGTCDPGLIPIPVNEFANWSPALPAGAAGCVGNCEACSPSNILPSCAGASLAYLCCEPAQPVNYGSGCARGIMKCEAERCVHNQFTGAFYFHGSSPTDATFHRDLAACAIGCGTSAFEICDGGLTDDDCDGNVEAPLGTQECFDESYDDDQDDPAAEDCDECGQCDGAPVDLNTRQMFVGPHEDVRIASPQGGSYDIAFSRTYDSKRATMDNLDDLAPGTWDQRPFPRHFGPGWRHSYDIRLFLEGSHDNPDQEPIPGNPNPLLVTLDTPTARTSMRQLVPGVYGDVPGSRIQAFQTGVGDTWIVLTDEGDELEFETFVDTVAHPWGVEQPGETRPQVSTIYSGRLKEIRPQRSTNYRLRLYYEDTASSVPGACPAVSGIPCDPSRGLLAAVRAEWRVGSSWWPGSSILLRYDQHLHSASRLKDQYTLQHVVEGADLDENGLAVGTKLADFAYGTPTGSNQTWRFYVRYAASCVGRTNSGGGDISSDSCANVVNNDKLGSRRWEYTIAPWDGWQRGHLLAAVKAPARTNPDSPALTMVDVETFEWSVLSDNATGAVDEHRSDGVELLAQSGDPQTNGVMLWSRNGETTSILMKRGRAVFSSSGSFGSKVRQREVAYSTTDPRKVVGVATQPTKEGTVRLRRFESFYPNGFQESDGQLVYEAEVVPASSTSDPVMSISADANFETVSFSGVATNGIRSVTRHYYTHDVRPRRVASATLSTLATSTSTPRFPRPHDATAYSTDKVPNSWVGPASLTSRVIPAIQFEGAGGNDEYYDVDVYDADNDLDNNLNEVDEDRVTWVHRARAAKYPDTSVVVRRYTSSRTQFDAYGRVTGTDEYATPTGSAVLALMAKSAVAWDAQAIGSSSTKARNRGRFASSSRALDLTGSAVLWLTSTQACPASDSPHDPLGRLVCSEVPQVPTPLRTVVSVTTPASPGFDIRREQTTMTVGGQVVTQTFNDALVGGFVVEAGTVGGLSTKTFASGGSATSASRVAATGEFTNSGTAEFARTTNTFDAYGPSSKTILSDRPSGGIIRRIDRVFEGDERRVALERHCASNCTATSPPSFDTETRYNLATERVNGITEPDGDEVDITVGALGGAAQDVGRVVARASGNPAITTAFDYEPDGRLSAIWRNATLTASYSYAEDQRLVKEILHAAGGVERHFDEAVVTFTTAHSGVVGRRESIEKVRASATAPWSRHLVTTFDNAGRPLSLQDRIPATPANVSVWTYDSKNAYAGLTRNTEGLPFGQSTGTRTFTFSDNNQLGRLAYVSHPAGATFFNYDGAGRITAEARYETTLPTAAPFNNTDSAKHLKVVEVAYQNGTGELTSIRYPSGRQVNYSYTTDKRGPAAVEVATSTNGLAMPITVLSAVQRDAASRVTRWTWAGISYGRHQRIYDTLGRITSIDDFANDILYATARHGLDYTYTTAGSRDGDPDAAFSTSNNANTPGVFFNTSATSQTVTYTSAAGAPDLLASWRDTADQPRSLTFTDALRSTHTHGSPVPVTYPYTYSGTGAEGIEERNRAGTFPLDLDIDRNGLGEATRVDYGDDGAWDLSSITYGPRGDVTSLVRLTAGTTLWSYARDHTMQRWRRVSSIRTISDRWGPGGQLLARRNDPSGTEWSSDEYVYLGSLPVAVVHTDNVNTTPQTRLLTTDQHGIPRRILNRDINLSQVARLVMDAWGDGFVPGAGPTIPELPFRYAGQLQDSETGLIENRWRMYLPTVGQYLSPDPEYRWTAQEFLGAQAYSYAAGRPLVVSDASGRRPWVDRYPSALEAARAALEEYNPRSIALDREFSGLIFKLKGESTYGYSELVPNQFTGGSDGLARKRSPGRAELRQIFSSRLSDMECEIEDIRGGCHTHGAANDDFFVEQFSDADMQDAATDGTPEWLATPSFRFLGYFPGSGRTLEYFPRLQRR